MSEELIKLGAKVPGAAEPDRYLFDPDLTKPATDIGDCDLLPIRSKAWLGDWAIFVIEESLEFG